MPLADILLLILIAATLYYGWNKGFIDSFIDISIWLGSFLITIVASEYTIRLFNHFSISTAWVRPAYFIVLLAGFSRLIFVQCDRLSAAVPDEVHGHPANRVAGLLPGFFTGVLFASLLAMFLQSYQVGILSASAKGSKLANALVDKTASPGKQISRALDQVGYKLGNIVTIHPAGGETIRLPFKTNSFRQRPDLEQQLLELLNAERRKHGLPALEPDERLAEVARGHSEDMLQRGYFSHQNPSGKGPFDRLREKGILYSIAGENLALARSIELVHEGFMTSDVHRANILSPAYGRAGIGVLDAGSHGLMVTQNFRN